MTQIIKLALFGITGTLLAIQFKAHKPEYAVYIGTATGLLIFVYCIGQVEAVLAKLSQLKEYLAGSESYLSILIRVIGITYICEFSAGICKDAGYSAVSDQIEILGKLSVMFAGLPILFAVIEQLQRFTA